MSGFIYCITNSKYKIEEIYKLGYTASKRPIDEVRNKLIKRYETYFIDTECILLVAVFNPVKAEKKLFDLLDDYRYQKEMFKADYETIIKPAIDLIESDFSKYEPKDNRAILRPKIARLSKKIRIYAKNNKMGRNEIDYYITSQNSCKETDRLNDENKLCFFRVNCLYHNCSGMLYMLDNKQKKIYLDDLERDSFNTLQSLDYSDNNISLFVNIFLKLIS